jgi:hypothetical protein
VSVTHTDHRLGTAVRLLVLLVGFAGSTATAQIPQPILKGNRGAKEMLATARIAAEKSGSAGYGLSEALTHPKQYPAAVLDSIVDGVEWMALHLKEGRARMWAAQTIATAGEIQQPIPTAFDRLIGLYKKADDQYVRSMILSRIELQSDQARAIAFLNGVALEGPRNQDFAQASLFAVTALSHMGVRGRAALVELRSGRKMTDPRAIGYVNWFLSVK